MFISTYRSDDVGAVLDADLGSANVSEEVMERRKTGFGQTPSTYEGIKLVLPTSSPTVDGGTPRLPSFSTGLRSLTQSLGLARIP